MDARILIVGGGVAGLATAYALARRGAGRGVLLVEREGVLGEHSSGRNAAILRTLAEDPLDCELARRAAAFLHEPPPGFAPSPLVDRRGLVLAARGPAARDLAAWVAREGREAGAEALDARALARVAPHFAPGAEAAFLFPRDGRIDVAALLFGLARGARAGGVAVETGAAVAELLREGDAVRGARLADGRELRARTTLLAAGGWAGALGAAAGSRVRLAPTRRHLLVTAPAPGSDPAWPVVWDVGEHFYCRPESGGMLLSACDEVEVDPDRLRTDPEVRERIAVKAGRVLPHLGNAGAAHFWAGLRTFAPDRRFVLGRDPDVPGLAWAAGLGGSGMTSGVEAGRLAAAFLLGTESRGDEHLLALVAPRRADLARSTVPDRLQVPVGEGFGATPRGPAGGG